MGQSTEHFKKTSNKDGNFGSENLCNSTSSKTSFRSFQREALYQIWPKETPAIKN